MALGLLRQRGDETPRVVPLTVDQYHEMITKGILKEGAPIELIDGLLIRKDRSKLGDDPMTVGTEHTWVVQGLVKLNPMLEPHNCHMRIQNPITLPPDNEPEPDGAIVRGDVNTYRAHHPFASDILAIIEVADSSLKDDRTIKLPLYARSGIGMFVIVDLVHKTIEVRTQPNLAESRYDATVTLRKGDSLSLPMADGTSLDIPAQLLLP